MVAHRGSTVFTSISLSSWGVYELFNVISFQLACKLNWYSTARVSQKSWIEITFQPDFFFRLNLFTVAWVGYITGKIFQVFKFSLFAYFKWKTWQAFFNWHERFFFYKESLLMKRCSYRLIRSSRCKALGRVLRYILVLFLIPDVCYIFSK